MNLVGLVFLGVVAIALANHVWKKYCAIDDDANFECPVVVSHDFADEPDTTPQPQTQSNPGTEPSNVGLEMGRMDDDDEEESNNAPVEAKKTFAFDANAPPFVTSPPSAVPTPETPETPVPKRVHNPYLPLLFLLAFPTSEYYRFDDPQAWAAIYTISPKETFEFPTEYSRRQFKSQKKRWNNSENHAMVWINLGGVSAVNKRHAVFAAGILGVVTGVRIYDVVVQGPGTVRFFIRAVDLHRFVPLSKRREFRHQREYLYTASPTYWLRSLCNGDVAVGSCKSVVDAVHPYPKHHPCPKHHGRCPGGHSCCPSHTIDTSFAHGRVESH